MTAGFPAAGAGRAGCAGCAGRGGVGGGAERARGAGGTRAACGMTAGFPGTAARGADGGRVIARSRSVVTARPRTVGASRGDQSRACAFTRLTGTGRIGRPTRASISRCGGPVNTRACPTWCRPWRRLTSWKWWKCGPATMNGNRFADRKYGACTNDHAYVSLIGT